MEQLITSRWLRAAMASAIFVLSGQAAMAQCIAPGTAINFSTTGNSMGLLYSTVYVLTNNNDQILRTVASGFEAPNQTGSFKVYTVTYNNSATLVSPKFSTGSLITELTGSCFAIGESPIEFCVTATDELPLASIPLATTGQTAAAQDYTTLYVLTNSVGSIISSFAGSPIVAPAAMGNYFIYTVNFANGSSPALAAGTNIAAIGGSCVNVGISPIAFTVSCAGRGTGADLLAINGDAATLGIVAAQGNMLTATSSVCRAVANILPNNTVTSITGSVTANVWIDPTVQYINGLPYLQRHYDISPATNAADATAYVTLYFAQTEFNAFNADPKVGTATLPTATDDAAGKARLRIFQYHGPSGDGSGSPVSYSGTSTTIDPDDADINWNDALQRWEVGFQVTGFSGFFVKVVDSALPLRLISFSGTQEATANKLTWETADEVNTKSFELESSKDGRNFLKVATIDAVSTGDNSYGYTDYRSYKGITYYRLKMIDIDGSFTYSRIISLSRDGKGSINLFPNPAADWLNLSLDNNLINSEASLYNTSGRLLQTIKITSGDQPVNVKTLPTGIYIIKFKDGTSGSFVKE